MLAAWDGKPRRQRGVHQGYHSVQVSRAGDPFEKGSHRMKPKSERAARDPGRQPITNPEGP